VRFIVDAQLPYVLASQLRELGHDAIHVKRLPDAGHTTDAEITRVADAEGRVVVTKDADFRHTHETDGHPRRLLMIAVGNVRNRDLLELIKQHHDTITAALDRSDFVELGRTSVTLHPRRDGEVS
jgi:predicted nuclease of predicted toxin-antitoxin system